MRDHPAANDHDLAAWWSRRVSVPWRCVRADHDDVAPTRHLLIALIGALAMAPAILKGQGRS